MLPPEWIDTNLIKDAKELIWDRTIESDVTTLGSIRTSKSCRIDDAISNPRRALKGKDNIHKDWALGLGLLNWEAHTAAIRIEWLLNYLDATDPPWKKVLDQWFSRTYLGRGAIFCSLRPQDLTAHLRDANGINDLESSLPKFWVQALCDLRLHKLTPIGTTREGVCGQPLWYNPQFKPPPSTAIYHSSLESTSRDKLLTTQVLFLTQPLIPTVNSNPTSQRTTESSGTVTTKPSPLNSHTKPKRNTTPQNYTRRGCSTLKP
jgi:hypothetical protein